MRRRARARVRTRLSTTFIPTPEEIAEQFCCCTLYFRLKIPVYRADDDADARVCVDVCASARISFSQRRVKILHTCLCVTRERERSWEGREEEEKEEKKKRERRTKANENGEKRIITLTVTTQAGCVN